MFGLKLDLGLGRAYSEGLQYLIQYLSSGGTFTFSTDATDKMELTNYGSGSNGLSYAGAGLELGATNELPLDVNYDLGSNEVTAIDTALSVGDETVSYTKNSDTAFDIDITAAGTNTLRPRMDNTCTSSASKRLLQFTASSVTGTLKIRNLHDGTTGLPVDYTVVDGHNEIEYELISGRTVEYITWDGLSVGGASITDWSDKEITTTGYLTYATDTEVVQLGNETDGGSSKELLSEGSFDTQSDFDAFENTSATYTYNAGGYVERLSGSTDSYFIKAITGIVVGKRYQIICSANITSGTPKYFYNNAIQATNVGDTIEFTATHTTVGVYTVGAVFNFDDLSVKEVLPNSTTYTLPVSDTYRWAYVNENAFSTADLTALEANPNKIVEYALDNANSDLTATQGVDDKFFAMSEYSS